MAAQWCSRTKVSSSALSARYSWAKPGHDLREARKPAHTCLSRPAGRVSQFLRTETLKITRHRRVNLSAVRRRGTAIPQPNGNRDEPKRT